MRIAIAGIVEEGLIFSPIKATAADFRVLRGPDLLRDLGVDSTFRELDMDPVPLLLASHLAPSGVVDEAAYVAWRDEIVEGLRNAGPLDGVCLVLHGAMTVERIWNGETDLLREVRAVVGYDVPIAARLDPHANITDEFANKIDTWTVFRTAPHRDAHETLIRTLRLLARRIRTGRRSRPAFVRVPMLLLGERATTDVEPMRSLLVMAARIESQPGILNAEVVVAEDEAHLTLARREARRLAQTMWDRRLDFTFDQEVAPTVDEAIDRAVAEADRCVFLADSGDNVTAGAPGDSTYVLSRLLAKGAPDAIVGGIPDGEVARRCFESGVGAEVSVTLGGKMAMESGGPIAVSGTVEHLYRPPEGSSEAAIATLRVEGVRVLITSIRKAFTTLDDFREAGIEPFDHQIVVVKLGYLFPEFRDAGPREILMLSPGYSDMDLRRLPYRYVTRPILPLDDDFDWHPSISGVAAYGDDRDPPLV